MPENEIKELSKDTLKKRINRVLKQAGEKIVVTRADKKAELGDLHTIDSAGEVLTHHVNLAALARVCGVLQENEVYSVTKDIRSHARKQDAIAATVGLLICAFMFCTLARAANRTIVLSGVGRAESSIDQVAQNSAIASATDDVLHKAYLTGCTGVTPITVTSQCNVDRTVHRCSATAVATCTFHERALPTGPAREGE